MIIKKHFKIVGQPGTILFFKSALLTLDLLSSELHPSAFASKDDRNYFRHQEPIVFSEIQFQFSIDLRAVAYKQLKLKQGSGGFGGNSHFENNSKSSK